MIVVAQRVRQASVTVGDELVGAIGHGLCLLVCALVDDGDEELLWLADKIVDLRVFADDRGLINLSLGEVGGDVLVVPQFTLAAEWRKGRRPSFLRAAAPDRAQVAVSRLVGRLRERGVSVAEGRFGATMDVRLWNEGPFTLLLDSALAPGRQAGRGA